MIKLAQARGFEPLHPDWGSNCLANSPLNRLSKLALAGETGFEPVRRRFKAPCVTTSPLSNIVVVIILLIWRGWKESNSLPPGSKPGALSV